MKKQTSAGKNLPDSVSPPSPKRTKSDVTVPQTPNRQGSIYPSAKTTSTPIGEILHESISEQSKADYTVYAIRLDNGQGQCDCVSVVIETKHMSHSKIKYVTAQLVGYCVAFDFPANPFTAFVITENTLNFFHMLGEME